MAKQIAKKDEPNPAAGSDLLDDLDKPATAKATAAEKPSIAGQIAELGKAWTGGKKKLKSGQDCNQPDCPGTFRTLTSGTRKPSKPGGRKIPYARLICDLCKHKEDA